MRVIMNNFVFKCCYYEVHKSVHETHLRGLSIISVYVLEADIPHPEGNLISSLFPLSGRVRLF